MAKKSEQQGTIYKSAVDTWFYGTILFTALILLASFLPAVLSGAPRVVGLLVLASLVGLGLPLWLSKSTYYWIQGDMLRIRSGPFHWEIEVSKIQSIEPSRSILSSPALSLDRLEIRHGQGQSVLVSPADKDGFLAALENARST